MVFRQLPGKILLMLAALLHGLSFAQSHPPLHEEASSSPRLTSSDLARLNLWSHVNSSENRSPLRGLSGSVSQLDLRASASSKQEYDKGYQLLMQRNPEKAAEHLRLAVSLFPDFVAAHNALGSAYLELGEPDRAREEFTNAVQLDDHLPNSYLNLGCAQISLKDYPGAEESLRKASRIAPLDPELASALVFAQYMNQHYESALDTVREVHSRKHPGAAMVHYYAAAVWFAQSDPQNAKSELQLFLQEDPKSASAERAQEMLMQAEAEGAIAPGNQKTINSPETLPAITPSLSSPTPQPSAQMPTPAKPSEQVLMANAKSDAASAAPRVNESSPLRDQRSGNSSDATLLQPHDGTFIFRSEVNEVAVLFAATDHGKSVTDLTRADVEVRDDQKPPAAITGFRNESQLPLRLGLVIDTSQSILGRFPFEQSAAIDFVRQVLTDKNDQAFVVGFANSVLLVQDFTNDQQRIARAINQLAPGGGTALWDAVTFAAERLKQPETAPVARMLVVISDGVDNSSAATLSEAMETAERGEVFVYTVSTGEDTDPSRLNLAGNKALRALAERTGGTAFVPSTFAGLNHALDNLQQVIRSRYLISYKPARFANNGRYRTIEISPRKSGQKLRIFARKGYYASTGPARRAAF